MKKNDKTIEYLLKEIEKQRTEIEKSEKEIRSKGFVTNMRLVVGDLSFNLQVQQNISLIELAGHILQKNDYFMKACSELNHHEDFIISGFSKDDWMHDIDLKIRKNKLVDKKSDLKKKEDFLNKKFSQEKKDQNDLEQIKKELGL